MISPQDIQKKIELIEASIANKMKLLEDLKSLLEASQGDFEKFTKITNELRAVNEKILSLEAEKERINASLSVLREERKRLSEQLNASNINKILKMFRAL